MAVTKGLPDKAQAMLDSYTAAGHSLAERMLFVLLDLRALADREDEDWVDLLRRVEALYDTELHIRIEVEPNDE